MTQLPEWNLKHLYATPESVLSPDMWSDMHTTINALCADLQAMDQAGFQQGFADFMQQYNGVLSELYLARAYAYLYFAQDTTRDGVGVFFQNVMEKAAEIDAVVARISSHIALRDEKELRQLLKSDEVFEYHRWLQRLVEMQPHVLSPETESQWVERSVVAGDAWKRLAEETQSKLEVCVGTETTNLENAYSMLRDADAQVRRKALDGLTDALKSAQSLLTQSFNAIAKDHAIASRWRRYDHIDDAMHQDNDVDGAWVDALRACVRESYAQTSHAVVNMRQHIIGGDTLAVSDLAAPLMGQSPLDWEQALTWVIEAYSDFDFALGEKLICMRREGRLDMVLRRGKTGGAFCYATPKGPYVLTNYHGRFRDFLVLAHELGHALHGLLSQHLPIVAFRTSLVLAEVASLFSEKLCVDYLLKKCATPDEQKRYMAHYVNDQVMCIQGSISYDCFEKKMHLLRQETELTSDVLCQNWVDVRQEFFGPGTTLPDTYGVIWGAIPHFFHTPFYVYSYAFSGLIMHAIYAQKGQPNFVDRYTHFLQSGGKMDFHTLRALFELSDDPKTFFRQALQSLYADVRSLEQLVYA